MKHVISSQEADAIAEYVFSVAAKFSPDFSMEKRWNDVHYIDYECEDKVSTVVFKIMRSGKVWRWENGDNWYEINLTSDDEIVKVVKTILDQHG